MASRRPIGPLGLAVVLSMALVGGCVRPARPAAGPSASPGPVYRVTGVTDGDTFHVRIGGRDERVRMIGIDTPEVPWYGGRGDCFGPEAGRYSKRRLTGASVRLVFDAERRDRYGRLLAYAYLGSELFNLTLVERGYARVETVRPNTRFQAAFAAAQAAAQAAGIGRWSACPS